MRYKLLQGDCLEVMKNIPDKSIDMILCDLPYGITRNKWDSVIPFDKLWEQYGRIIKDDGAIVLTASQPFTSQLVMSKYEWFRYEWIWEKQRASNFTQVKRQPLKYHENILIFSKKPIKTYNPQRYKVIELEDIQKMNKKELKSFMENKDYDKFSKIDRRKNVIDPKSNKNYLGSEGIKRTRYVDDGYRYPKSVLKINNKLQGNIHPTQKPVSLFEYLIKTYTNENDLVLDNCMGSGTTGVACLNTNRRFVGIELDKAYFQIAQDRIKNHEKSILEVA